MSLFPSSLIPPVNILAFLLQFSKLILTEMETWKYALFLSAISFDCMEQ